MYLYVVYDVIVCCLAVIIYRVSDFLLVSARGIATRDLTMPGHGKVPQVQY